MAKYSIYVGGVLDSEHETERAAFYREKELQWSGKQDVSMEYEGEERFVIVPVMLNGRPHYYVMDRRTESQIYGVCETMEQAMEAKAWDEKYHYEGGKWMDEYYKQFA